MGFVELTCPRCGAPLPAREAGVFHCAYCATPLVPSRDGFRISDAFEDEPLLDPELPRFWLAGSRYAVLGRLGRGEGTDVFLARRDQRLSERVVAKVLRAEDALDLLQNEWSVLESLQASRARGSDHFSRLWPQPVAHGEARLGLHGAEGTRWVSVLRFESGYVHSFEDVRRVYPDGVPPRASVWLLKRVLELLILVHESGWVHAGILPRHALVHARDHGVRLTGWSSATPTSAKATALVADAEAFYPKGVWAGGAVSPTTDLVMAARSVLWLLGGHPLRAPSKTPPPLARLLEVVAAGDTEGTAPQLIEALDDAAQQAFGPPTYVPFAMPGWNIA